MYSAVQAHAEVQRSRRGVPTDGEGCEVLAAANRSAGGQSGVDGLESRHEPVAVIDGQDAAPGHAAGEGDDSVGGCAHHSAAQQVEIDPAVTGTVFVRGCDIRLCEPESLGRPDPLARGRIGLDRPPAGRPARRAGVPRGGAWHSQAQGRDREGDPQRGASGGTARRRTISRHPLSMPPAHARGVRPGRSAERPAPADAGEESLLIHWTDTPLVGVNTRAHSAAANPRFASRGIHPHRSHGAIRSGAGVCRAPGSPADRSGGRHNRKRRFRASRTGERPWPSSPFASCSTAACTSDTRPAGGTRKSSASSSPSAAASTSSTCSSR